jgi:two-component system nitrate/nitrite response regulator NarL
MNTLTDEKIKILLVDDHPVVREGVRSSLVTQQHFCIVGEASNGEEAIERSRELQPDVVLMDISMPHMSGLESVKRLTKLMPEVNILVLTMYDNKEYILQIARSGARGYILKDVHPSELIKAIECVYAGEMYFSPAVNQVLLSNFLKDDEEPKDADGPRLSHREREVLSLIADGQSNKTIASQLFVSVRTIETHRERIMRKLNIHTAAGLTKYAIAKGIIKLD